MIGTRAQLCRRRARRSSHVAGYCICNDVSERDFQLERARPVDQGQERADLRPARAVARHGGRDRATSQTLDMWLDVNGERMQTGSTATMIFDVRQLVSYISQFMILEPGDVITTGTPPGVGIGKKPPHFLKAGDVMTLGIDGLGQQTQRVVAWKAD